MKRLLFFLILFYSFGLNGQTFINNGVYYSIVLFTNNVKVASAAYPSSYKGDIVIPKTVEYNNETYSVVSVENYAFVGSPELTSVTLPQTITDIGEGAFSGCPGLTSFIIPENVKYIGSDAFRGSNNIKEIRIPKSVITIGARAFSGIERLILEDGETPLRLVTLYSINDNTPFYICPLESIYLGRNLNYTTGFAPFKDNVKLKSLVVGDSVTAIGSYLFKNCSSLSNVVISSSVSTVGQQAFYGCNALNNVTCYAKYPPTTYIAAFSESSISSATLSVLNESIGRYRTATDWSNFGTIVGFGPSEINKLKTDDKSKNCKDGKYIIDGNVIIIKRGKKYSLSGTIRP